VKLALLILRFIFVQPSFNVTDVPKALVSCLPPKLFKKWSTVAVTIIILRSSQCTHLTFHYSYHLKISSTYKVTLSSVSQLTHQRSVKIKSTGRYSQVWFQVEITILYSY